MNQRTKPITLILLAIVAAAIAWMLESWFVSNGMPMFVAPITMPITLVVVAIALIALAWPVRKYTRWLTRARDRQREARRARGVGDPDASGHRGDPDRDPVDDRDRRDPSRDRDGRGGRDGRDRDLDEPPKRVDPVFAIRVLAFAKASSLAGSVIGGAAVSVVVFVLTRPVIAEALLPLSIAGLVGAAVLLVAGLIAESWCVLPPDDRDAQRANAPSRPLMGA